MPTWADVIILAVLLALGAPTIVRGLRAWWRYERRLWQTAQNNEVRW